MTVNLLQATRLVFDLERARGALQTIVDRCPFTPQRRQISLTHRREDQPSLEDGVGSLYDIATGKWLAQEAEFQYFHRDFKATYFHEVYLQLQDFTGGHIGRVRLMNLAPKSCYSFHQDPSMRFHLVLQTNDQCFMIFAPDKIMHLPANGHVYRADTRCLHTAMNGGQTDRIHLVFSATNEDANKRTIEIMEKSVIA